jgi:hypothetical protein
VQLGQEVKLDGLVRHITSQLVELRADGLPGLHCLPQAFYQAPDRLDILPT